MIADSLHPNEKELRALDIHELLPQQEPFVMVSSLVGFDERKTITELEVMPGNLFVEQGHFTAEGLMENIAQTCAARIGYVNKFILKKGIQIGFIGAVRNMEVTSLPRVGDKITTVVEVQEEVFGMTLASAIVTCNGTELASTEIKIAVKSED